MSKGKVKEMICILDRSGSMYGKERSTIRSYNEMLRNQKSIGSEAYITTVLFSDRCETLYHRIPIESVKDLDETAYYVYGNTALFDAVGQTLSKVDHSIACSGWEENESVMAFIITDGMENASYKYSGAQLKQIIEEKQKKGWVILFFGTDMETINQAQKMGIRPNNTARYESNEEGIRKSYQMASDIFDKM